MWTVCLPKAPPLIQALSRESPPTEEEYPDPSGTLGRALQMPSGEPGKGEEEKISLNVGAGGLP